MSFLTWRCDFPQKEHSSCSLESVGRATVLPPVRFRRRSSSLVGRDHAVDDAVLLGLLGGHEVVALRVAADLLDVLLRVPRDDLVELPPQLDDLARVDLDVRGLALEAGGHLMDEDL